MKPRRNLYGIHNDFSAVGGGLRRGCISIRNRDGVGWDDKLLCLRTHGRCYTIVMLVVHAHMVDAMQHVGWGGM